MQADAITLEFEEKLRDWLLAFGESYVEPLGYNLYATVARGYVDTAKEQIVADIWLLPVGFLVVTAYGTLMLGHLTCVENRVRKERYSWVQNDLHTIKMYLKGVYCNQYKSFCT